MGNPATEQDIAPPFGTFRRFVWETVAGIKWARAFFGRRLIGGAYGLIADAIGEGVTQSNYSRMPGHAQQAPDSLTQCANDTDLFRFRGETDANWAARVSSRWDDYEQAGTDIQLKRVINQWGVAGWPSSWDSNLLTLVESGDPFDWSFDITIPYGMILPAWIPTTYGSGEVYGSGTLFYGIGPSTDIRTLYYLVKKWKRSASLAHVNIYWSVSDYVTLDIG